VEFLICLNEKQNEFCENNLISFTKKSKSVKGQTIKLVIFTGFNCPMSWTFPDTFDIIDRCVCHENIDLRNMINNVNPAKTAVKSIDLAIKQQNNSIVT
jgi:hypothetical protein